MDCESCVVEEQCHLLRKTEQWEKNLCLIEKSDTEDVFSSQKASSPSSTQIKLSPKAITRRCGFSDNSHLLKVPTVEDDDVDIKPYQFHRHAPGRISTSPTLRRLRSSTSSASQLFPLQYGTENTTMDSPMAQTDSLIPVCQHPLIYSQSYSSSHPSLCKSSLSLREKSPSIDPISFQPHLKDGFCDDQKLQNTTESNPSFLPEGKQNSQECGQELDLHISTSPYSSTERRHSSVVVSLPGFEMFPGDLLISDSAAKFLYHSASLQSSESKKLRWPFAKKGTSKGKHKHISDLENYLSTLTIRMSQCHDYEFHSIKSKTWQDIMAMHQLQPGATGDQLDVKKKEAVWELFTTECTYFLDQLLVLKMIFMDTLQNLQSKSFLPDVDSGLLFANLEELNKVSLSFVTSFFSAIKNHLNKLTPSIEFTAVLNKYFQGNLCQSHQVYCLNYTSAIFYLEKLKKREDFGTYLKWCEQNEQCKRLHLSELLVAPLHKLTRYPLLLKNIWKNTEAAEKTIIGSLKEKVEKSIRDLEGKVKWLDNFQKFKQLQEIIFWPSLWDQDKRFFVPEGFKNLLRDNPSENILSPTKRSLVHEGRLTLSEHLKITDVYLFLFDDLLLITKPNRQKKKSGGPDLSLIPACHFFSPELQSLLEESSSCTVLDQPIPLDRLVVKNIDSFHITAFGLRNAFLIQHENRYHQCIAAFLLQAQTDSAKKTWISQIETAVSKYMKTHNPSQTPFFHLPAESSEI
ncbi:pleckstrin homology domain-containing family G member 7 [Sceloporus undulatus]|uniref:pleckstrin homology domain-containing family G member 7 n=1 Tax=Sceloporus undulatus TaxID=8520 RepID=UPI001C4CC6E3|nr:pleckstrin homology domain-containing family G member 7 [Sceloporus undulatus]